MMVSFKSRAQLGRMRLFAGAATAAALFAGTPAFAAPADATPAPSPAAVDPAAAGPAPGEIVVTAQKRSESVTKVPISISVLGVEALKNSGVTEILDLPHAVPALRVNLAGTFVLPTIRGVGSMVALPGLTQNIATYVDGFYVPSPAADNFDLVNVESVNVLKGPQGTLFGANAVGGAIVINTLKPKEEFSGFARVGVGSYGDTNAALYMTGGLAKGISADIAASVDHGNGWITNVANGDHHVAEYTKWQVRPQVLIEPAAGVKLLFSYAHDYDNDPYPEMVVPYNGYSSAPEQNVAQGLTTTPGQTQLAYGSPKQVALDPTHPGYAIRKSDAWTFRGDFDLGFANLSALTAYRKDNINQELDYTASNPLPIGQLRQWVDSGKTFTQEVNLTSNHGNTFTWVIGGFYLDYKNQYDYNTDVDANYDMANIFVSKNHSQTFAGYADATYQPIEHLFLTFGGRYSYDKFTRDYTFGPDFGGGSDFSPQDSFHNFSVRAVARYEITPRTNIYTSFSQGYRSGGLPGSQFGSDVPVKPEHINAYEVGLKTAEGPLRLNLAGFFYDYKDIQVTSYGTDGVSDTVNAGEAHIYGLDGDVTYAVTHRLSVGLTGTLLNAHYTNFGAYNSTGTCINCAYETLYTAAFAPGGGYNPVSGGFNQGALPATGNQIERTPNFAGGANVDYAMPAFGGQLKLNANLFFTESYWLDALHQLRDPSYTTLNLRATWTDPSARFDISVFGKNINNARYFIGITADTSAAPVTCGAPSLYGAQVTFHFH